MRNFLLDKKIVGAIIVSKHPEIFEIAINNLLKWCDWVLVMVDCEDEETINKVLEIQKQNYDKMWVRRSSFLHKLIGRNGKIADYRQRWKCIKGLVRNSIFIQLREILNLKMKKFNRIDILLFPDSDECYTDSLPKLLEEFWNSQYKAIAVKHIHVVNDMMTIKDSTMMSHVHIFKWSDGLCGYPWQHRNQMHPISWSETMRSDYVSVHLCYLTDKLRKWRYNNWKPADISDDKLYKLNQSVLETNPDEIKNILSYEKLSTRSGDCGRCSVLPRG